MFWVVRESRPSARTLSRTAAGSKVQHQERALRGRRGFLANDVGAFFRPTHQDPFVQTELRAFSENELRAFSAK